MVVFVAIIFLLFFLCLYLEGSRQKENNIFYFIFLYFFFFIFSGIRGDIGRDYSTYINSYYNAAKQLHYYLDWNSSFVNEPMVDIIGSIAKYWLGDYFYFFFLFGFIGVSLKFYAIRKYSPLVFLSILIYYSKFFMLHELTQIRAGVASGIILCSLHFIKSKEFFKYIIGILLACSFHFTALIALPLYFIDSNKLNQKKWTFFILLSLLGVLFSGQIFSLLDFIGFGSIFPRFTIYYELLDIESPSLLNPYVYIHVFLVFFGIWSFKYYKHLDYYIIFIKVYSFSLILFFIFFEVAAFSIRLKEMLQVVEIVLIPIYIYYYKYKSYTYVLCLYYSCSLALSYLLYINLFSTYVITS